MARSFEDTDMWKTARELVKKIYQIDQAYLSDNEFQNGRELCVNISGQISGMINYLKGSRLKGDKFNTELKDLHDEVSS